MSSKVDPSTWSDRHQLQFVAELGALEPAELASALCIAVRAPPDGAMVLPLGFWPRKGQVERTTITNPQLVQTILHQAELYAPGKGISWILVLQGEAPVSPKDVLKHIRIVVQNGTASVSVVDEHGCWVVCALSPCNTLRRITVFAGSLRVPLAPVILRNLRKMGFSLRHVQPKCNGEVTAPTC